MPELIDTKATMALLQVGRGTLAYLSDRGDLGDVFWHAPQAKQKRLFFLRERIERLARDDTWRRRSRPEGVEK